MKSDYIEIGGWNAKNPVLIAGVPSPSFSRFNFCLPTPFQFTTATLAKELTRAFERRNKHNLFFLCVSLQLFI